MLMNKIILSVLRTKAENLDNLSDTKQADLDSVKAKFVVEDREESEQGYVSIVNEDTGRSLVISKDRAGKTFFFDGWRRVSATGTYRTLCKTFDFYGYLMSEKTERKSVELSAVEKYTRTKQDLEFAEKRIKEINFEMDKLQSLKDLYEEDVKKYSKELESI